MSLAFDISAWQGRPSLAWFQQMKAAGYEMCWIQLWGLTPNGNGPNPHAAYQLAQARAAGMTIGGYIVVYGDATDDTHILVQVALAAAGAEKENLKFVALDIETAPIRMTRVLNAYDQIGAQLPGVTRAMYTSAWKWSIAFGAAKWPYAATTPLLEARYVLNSGYAPATPPPLDWFWVPFGGWTQRAMLQYAGTVKTFDVGVDRCVFEYDRMRLQAAPTPPPAPEEYHMPSSEYSALLNLINKLGKRMDGLASAVAALQGKPAPKPPAPAAPVYVIVKSGDTASKWVATEAAFLKLNPNFPTIAYTATGGIMRRFSPARRWNDIYPPERLRIK